MGGTPLLSALGLLSALWPFHQERQTVTERYLIPAWHVDATRDRFTGEMRCRVYQGKRKKPDVAYAQGVLTFRFARKLDTTRASFRVDNGAVQPWSAVYPQIVETGARVRGKSLDNPTEGQVLLPAVTLSGAHVVTIRPTPDRKPRLFSVNGFTDALSSGQAQGCDVRTGFVA